MGRAIDGNRCQGCIAHTKKGDISGAFQLLSGGRSSNPVPLLPTRSFFCLNKGKIIPPANGRDPQFGFGSGTGNIEIIFRCFFYLEIL